MKVCCSPNGTRTIPDGTESVIHGLDVFLKELEKLTQCQELSFIRFNPSSTVAQKGVDSVFLGEYREAIELIDQSLKIYDPRGVSGRARLIAMKAEAYLKIGSLDACINNAKEALTLAQTVGLHKIVDRVMKLHAELQQSRWKEEASITQLGQMLVDANTEQNKVRR